MVKARRFFPFTCRTAHKSQGLPSRGLAMQVLRFIQLWYRTTSQGRTADSSTALHLV
jgi:hypothetical protein